MKQLGRLRYQDGTSVSEHLNRLEHLFNRLNSMGVVFSNEVQSLWILSTLPDSWDTLCVSLSNSTPAGGLTKSIVNNSMYNEEARRKGQNGEGSSNAEGLLVYEQKRVKQVSGRQGRNTRDKREDQCHYCNKVGHWKADCFTFKKDQANGTVRKKSDNNNLAVVNAEMISLL